MLRRHLSETEINALKARYHQDTRCDVRDFLSPELAQPLFEAITHWPHWNLETCIAGQHRDFDAAGMKALSQDRRQPFIEAVYQGAQSGFQYLFENFALYEAGRDQRLNGPFLTFFDFLKSDDFLGLMRAITGHSDIHFADCQATRFQPGHFLTRHNDGQEDKHRRTAYVLNLTPNWRADFGGQLQFIDAHGDISAAFTPDFNRLCLFNVPQDHSVSCIAPFAPHPRIALTGWLRYGDPE